MKNATATAAHNKGLTEIISELPMPLVMLGIELFQYDKNAKRRKVGPQFDQDFWDRQWRRREQARAIIEGRAPRPKALRYVMYRAELRYHEGVGKIPPWCDPANLTRPQRERMVMEEREHSRRVAA